MFAGKTTELIRRVECARAGGRRVLVAKPVRDVRYAPDAVVTHACSRELAVAVHDLRALLPAVNSMNRLIPPPSGARGRSRAVRTALPVTGRVAPVERSRHSIGAFPVFGWESSLHRCLRRAFPMRWEFPIFRIGPVARGAITLDLSTDGVPELLANFEALVAWEAMRRMPAPAIPGEIAAAVGASTAQVHVALETLTRIGLVETARARRGRTTAYRARRGPLVVTFDPSDPKSAFRLAAARLALLAHLRRLGNARASRAARKGAAWRRESVAVLPLSGPSLETVRSCIDRVDACLEAASMAVEQEGHGTPDGRPMYRVQVAVDPVESRSLALPVVLLMERGDAARREAPQPGIASLSTRERQVAAELAAGRTKREVAEALGLSFATVNTLAVRTYRKLGVTRRAQLANALRQR
jgi:DNA-binding CsgD family transcriptional regulator